MVRKAFCALAAVIMIMAFAGCDGRIDVSRLVEEPLAYTPPEYSDYPEKVYPGKEDYHPDYEGHYIVVTPVMGNSVRLNEMEYLVQEIFDAYSNTNLLVGMDIKTRFKNKLTVYSSSGIELLTLTFASDDSLYARPGNDGPIFRMPQYIYYTLESMLWQVGGSLEDPLTKWTPYDTTLEEDQQLSGAGNAPVELQIPHDIKTMLVSIYGKHDSYFINFEIYSTAVSEQTVRVYLMAGYACYDEVDKDGNIVRKGKVVITEEDGSKHTVIPETIEYKPVIRDATPIKLVYQWVEGKMWRITEFNFPRNYNIKKSHAEADIRYIMPFEDTKRALAVLKNTDDIYLDLYRQALDHLRETGRGQMPVVK